MASPPAFSWHPKITPYRLAFIVITTGLGITKAVLVSYGQVDSSITVEWVAGVPVALCFQFFNAYEYKIHRSAYIDWVFSYDCLNILKMLIRHRGLTASAPPPHFVPNRKPIVTAYRLLVSASVATFGTAKTLSAYLGASVAMNTFDWIVSIPLTLGLYYIGLYEENRSNTPRKLFDVDYSSEAMVLFKGASFGIWFTICAVWVWHWCTALHMALSDEEIIKKTHNVWYVASALTFKIIWVAFQVMMVVVGVFCACVALWPIIKRCSGRYASTVRDYGGSVLGVIVGVCICILVFFALLQNLLIMVEMFF